MLKFGDIVEIDHKLRRVYKTCALYTHYKDWEPQVFKTGPKIGILIGFRTLCNGIVHYTDDGKFFEPREYVKAALVVLSDRTKPILVLLESVRNDIEVRR